jgi:hypothetical protein
MPQLLMRFPHTVQEYGEKVEYLYWNPVRPGLVERPEDGPWSSVHDYAGTVNQAPVIPTG